MTDTALDQFKALPARHDRGDRAGLTSVCSAHPLVIEAGLIEAAATGAIACIEATCNQVNQDGGYTGMTPATFRLYVLDIARKVGFPEDRILFGGDHLGPNPWRKQSAEAAMAKAIAMTHAYAAAGFGKLHLDASMACADDTSPLPATVIAERAAQLAKAAEAGAQSSGQPLPAYIIGTEVPIPGGAAEELEELVVTDPDDAAATIELHRTAFEAAGLTGVLERVVGLVVQPGVEFGHANVIAFAPAGAAALSARRDQMKGIVYEAHSTDYQTAAALKALVQGGFAILKVGPGLTFALREAFYGLDQIAGALSTDYAAGTLPAVMEQLMLAHPGDWDAYYHGSASELHQQRHFSLSDRIRYYWNRPEAEAAVQNLFATLAGKDLPGALIAEHLPMLVAGVTTGNTAPEVRALALGAVRLALAPYSAACADGPA